MPTIALDADGVLLNYHEAYRAAWERAFGVSPAVRDGQAYWPLDRWSVDLLTGSSLQHFRRQFDDQFWSSIPANEGAVEACLELQAAGFDLICVSAIEDRFLSSRVNNLHDCGFPIERVYATSGIVGAVSPKSSILTSLAPVAFVDDYLPYMRGLPLDIHSALVMREPNGSPNTGDELALVNSRHHSLADFSRWWLARL